MSLTATMGQALTAKADARDYEAAPRCSEAGRETMTRPVLDIEDLYRRYGDLVFSRCRTLLINEADAQEAMQEVFLRVWRYRNSFRGEASPTTWLFKVTTTTCLNRMRTRRRRPEDPVEDFPTTAANDSLLDEIEMRELVSAILAEADERTALALVYHYADGMTHEEVGAILGVTGAAIRKRIAKFKAMAGTRFPHLAKDKP